MNCFFCAEETENIKNKITGKINFILQNCALEVIAFRFYN
jgi:hypothetical protein